MQQSRERRTMRTSCPRLRCAKRQDRVPTFATPRSRHWAITSAVTSGKQPTRRLPRRGTAPATYFRSDMICAVRPFLLDRTVYWPRWIRRPICSCAHNWSSFPCHRVGSSAKPESTRNMCISRSVAIVSVLYELENGTAVEVALTGNEGLVGVQAFMGGGAATSRAVVRSTGYGYRLRADALKEKFERCPLLRHSLLRYAQALIAQVTQTAVCHCHHRLEQQVSRLLLLSLDRLPSNELDLTQEAMANLLGVRRESITETSGKLQAAGLIRYHRGRITVLNRPATGSPGL